MELRVLHTIAHGTTWYGRWGYAFGRGGFNLTAAAWVRTLNPASYPALLRCCCLRTLHDIAPEMTIMCLRKTLKIFPVRVESLH